jgi:5-methylcytosine-specific restriction endonuclease McrA
MRELIIKCKECGKTAPNRGHGLCHACYGRYYYRKNIDQVRAYTKAWQKASRIANPEYHKALAKKSRTKHRTEILIKKKAYYRAHKFEKQVYDRTYRDKKRFGGNWQRTLDRDGHKCQKCGSGHNLLVHHVDKHDARYPIGPPNHSLENLTTLCFDCHALVHIAGKRKKHLDQGKLVALYRKTGNLSEVARYFSVDGQTIKKRLVECGTLLRGAILRKGAKPRQAHPPDIGRNH